MATVSQWNPFGVSLNITATKSDVERLSATKYKVTINVSWETYWDDAQTNYGMTASSGGDSITLNKFGNKASKGSGTLTGEYSISGNASATKNVTVAFKNFNTDNGDSATKNVTFSVTVPAWTSYTISYNANGGSGAPSSQTKWKNQDLTLSSTKPTRTGYTFSKWNTAKDGSGTSYSAGAKYTTNSGATLYAQWTANKYTITYDPNGGTLGSVKSQTKTYGVDLKLTGTATRSNYSFLGWSTNKSATKATYSTGSNFTTNANTTLYAIWSLSYTKPRITGLSVERCLGDENKTLSDEGTYALVRFNWATDENILHGNIFVKESGTTTWSGVDIEQTGTGGSVSMLIGDGNLYTDVTYDFKVTIEDLSGSSYKTATLQGTLFPIDVKSSGKGVALGGPANIENAADFYYKILARQDLIFSKNNLYIRGTKPDGNTVVNAFQAQNENGNTIIGYGNYDLKSGNTNVYGYDVNIGISNIAADGGTSFRPYRRRGDSITFDTVRTSGYVTSGGKEVVFWIPLAVPIIGTPTVTASSINGFVLRQGGKYTHGSNYTNNTYVWATPSKYAVSRTTFCGVWMTATFTDTTNVTDNDAIGVTWSGTLTFE